MSFTELLCATWAAWVFWATERICPERPGLLLLLSYALLASAVFLPLPLWLHRRGLL